MAFQASQVFGVPLDGFGVSLNEFVGQGRQGLGERPWGKVLGGRVPHAKQPQEPVHCKQCKAIEGDPWGGASHFVKRRLGLCGGKGPHAKQPVQRNAEHL